MKKEEAVWIEHNNGPRPVSYNTRVYIKHDDIILGPAEAGNWEWEAADAPKGSMFYALADAS